MSGPPGGLKASVEHMRTTAGNWHSGSDRLTAASTASANLAMTRLEAVLFQVTWASYDSATNYVRDRLHEGGIEFENIARALNTSAHAYETSDSEFVGDVNHWQPGVGQ